MPGLLAETRNRIAAAGGRAAAAWTFIERHRPLTMGLSVTIVAVALAARVLHGLHRLGNGASPRGGIDLWFRLLETQAWFAGEPVYGAIPTSDYPPASYVMLWPFVGWLERMESRWLWAAVTVFMLIWLGVQLARESTLPSRAGRLLLGMLPAAGYATHATLATGQIAVHVVALLAAGTLCLVRSRSLRDDLVGTALFLGALAKPTMSAPVAWVVLFAAGRVRPALLVGAGYLALTAFASQFQPAGPLELLATWARPGNMGNVTVDQTTANLQLLLQNLGLHDWALPAALLLFFATGAWVFVHRKIDPWILLAVTALVSRLWIYHRSTDDLLLVLPIAALTRLFAASRDPARRGLLGAGTLLLAAVHLAPRLLLADVETAILALRVVQPAVWLLVLLVLLREAAAERRAPRIAPAAERNEDPAAEASPVGPAAWGGNTLAPAFGGSRRLWLALCFGPPVATAFVAYVWLAIDHGTPWLWNVVVHESGNYTLGQTIFYFSHFLREIPSVLAIVLFILAAHMPAVRTAERRVALDLRYAFPAMPGLVLCVLAFVPAVHEFGFAHAMQDLLQFRTRDDVSLYGSHWHYHWLSTLWLGLAATVAARLASRWFGVPVAPAGRTRLRTAAWVYFAGLTAVFGLAPEILTSPLYIGHQAREILTHAVVTLPLAAGLIGLFAGRHAEAPANPDVRVDWQVVAVLVTVPLFLGMAILYGNVVSAGQTRLGLAAMVGAHFFEHSLDFILVALFAGAVGISATGWSAHRVPSASGRR